jgi:hypothetical protein
MELVELVLLIVLLVQVLQFVLHAMLLITLRMMHVLKIYVLLEKEIVLLVEELITQNVPFVQITSLLLQIRNVLLVKLTARNVMMLQPVPNVLQENICSKLTAKLFYVLMAKLTVQHVLLIDKDALLVKLNSTLKQMIRHVKLVKLHVLLVKMPLLAKLVILVNILIPLVKLTLLVLMNVRLVQPLKINVLLVKMGNS